MQSIVDQKKAFIALFQATARYHHRYRVFSDFVQCAAIAIQNRLSFDTKAEQQYLNIIKGYEKEDVNRLSHLLSHVALGLELGHQDFLGSVFMELELGDVRNGQFFTPYEISRMMARILVYDMASALKEKPFVTLSEPACGAGSMVIAVAEEMLEKGFNPFRHLWVHAQDISSIATDMCYIQLSLLNIPAVVVTGNSLQVKQSRARHTPAWYLGNWGDRLRQAETAADSKQANSFPQVATSEPESEQEPEPVSESESEQLAAFWAEAETKTDFGFESESKDSPGVKRIIRPGWAS
ncbi:MAG: N-6 DNA methylase [Enterobacteriaceae bacterium]